MIDIELSGSVKSILGEYLKAINELIIIIKPLNNRELIMVVDEITEDEDCKSIQTILSHVVCSGYGYSIYIENAIGYNKNRQERVYFTTINQYVEQLGLMYKYCEYIFKNNHNLILEQTDNSKKITVNSGRQYDIEQLLEHAIVHVLRHRQQIERFIQKQKNMI